MNLYKPSKLSTFAACPKLLLVLPLAGALAVGLTVGALRDSLVRRRAGKGVRS